MTSTSPPRTPLRCRRSSPHSQRASARGWRTTHIQTDPLSGRFLVADPDTGEECEVDVLKEAFWAPPAQTPYGPVLSLDDVIGIIEAVCSGGMLDRVGW
ncbi:hypothetical protein ACFVH9_34045 [Streptomyces hirsutus]|uniref:hypothetical protein n=1 Tax=Streptomyces hirsutus TaxID=35620 RepID=UPI003637DA8F